MAFNGRESPDAAPDAEPLLQSGHFAVGDQLRFFAGSFGGAPGPLLFLSKNSMPAFVGTVSTIAALFRPCHAGLVWFRLNDLTVVIWVWWAPSHHKNLFGALLRGNCLRWLAKGSVHQL